MTFSWLKKLGINRVLGINFGFKTKKIFHQKFGPKLKVKTYAFYSALNFHFPSDFTFFIFPYTFQNIEMTKTMSVDFIRPTFEFFEKK